MPTQSPTTFNWGTGEGDLFGAKAATVRRSSTSPQQSPIDGKPGWQVTNGGGSSPGGARLRQQSMVAPDSSPTHSSPTHVRRPSMAPDASPGGATLVATPVRGRKPSMVPETTPVDDSNFRSRSLSTTPRRPSAARRGSTFGGKQRTRSVAGVPIEAEQRRASLYRQGSVGNMAANEESEISKSLEMKCNIMVQHLYHQLRERLWLSDRPIDEGVVLKMTRDAYTCCPGDLAYQQDGFLDAVEGLNVKVAVTISTEVISLFLSSREATFIPLGNGLRLQVLPNMAALPSCQKHQFAAFIADRGCLVIWDDDPRYVLERASKLVNEIVMLIWEDGLEDDNAPVSSEKKPEVVVSEMEKVSASSSQVDIEHGERYTPRRRVAWQPISVGIMCILLFLATGTGYGQVVEEIYYDRYYWRLLLILVMPMQLWLSLFFFQSMVCSVLQMFGPISQMKRNTKFYSGIKPVQKPREPGTQLPHVTIQMPVYKEGLQSVIEPTIISLKAAISTYEMQGGTASIFINDDGMQLVDPALAQQRRDFYDEHNIGWVARPKHNPNPTKEGEEVFVRRGKFKKASNMNYAMWCSCRVEDKLRDVIRHYAWSEEDETNAYYEALAEVIDEDEGRTWANGNIRIGDYILIIDSDTRVPFDCLLDATTEMEESPDVAIIQYISGVMNVTTSFFESAITNFTRLVYTQIKFAVANGDVAPFVGHNAVLRWTAIQSIGYFDELDQREKFWSEDTVSEDFDIALRLQALGWILRLGAYTGDGFQEGVSLTVYDELARWEKYAYGCSELLFHPVNEWWSKGFFTPLFKRFIFNKHMPLSAKITIMSYVGTYYAIGSAAVLTLVNYFLIGWLNGWLDHFYMSSFRIYFAMYIVFTGAGNVSLAVVRYRTGEGKLLPQLWQAFKWVPLMTIFLGGISIHVGQAILSHMFSIDMQWGATSKEVDDVSFLDEIPRVLKSFKYTFIMCGVILLMMIVLGTGIGVVPGMWQIKMVIAVWPLLSIVLGHLFLPLLLNPGLMRFTF